MFEDEDGDIGLGVTGSLVKLIKELKSIDKNMPTTATGVKKSEIFGILDGLLTERAVNKVFDGPFGGKKLGDGRDLGRRVGAAFFDEAGFFGVVVVLIEPAEDFGVGEVGLREGSQEGVEVIEVGGFQEIKMCWQRR